MNIEKLAQIADEFVIKLAEHHYEDNAPEDKRADDIKWITPEERQAIKDCGTEPTLKPHNPPSSVASEKTWDRAKKVTKKYWKNYKEPWAVVYSVYRKMHGKPKKKKSSKG